MWTQAATGACGDDEPCPLGRADQGHFFQRDDNPWVDKREVLPLVAKSLHVCTPSLLTNGHPQVFDAEDADYPKIAYEFPWDPTEDPQKFHIIKSYHRVDCEDGKLTDECYKSRWSPTDPSVTVGKGKEYGKTEPNARVVPKGRGGGTADTELPPANTGVGPPAPPPPGKLPQPRKLPPTDAPRPKEDIGDSPLEKYNSEGVGQERGKSEFHQPVGTPESIKGKPPEPKKTAPPEARKGKGPEARPQSGYANVPLANSSGDTNGAVASTFGTNCCWPLNWQARGCTGTPAPECNANVCTQGHKEW
jgi:hypothetical protein